MIQYSFKNSKNNYNLFLVATPIGNISEISSRAIKILTEVDCIYCEDTRTTIKLLNNLGIKNKLLSLHKFNEINKVDYIIDKFNNEMMNIAIVSDAGYPLISDPGNIIVKAAIKNNINVIPINGPCAFICALVASGLRTDFFSFIGFLKSKTSTKRQKELNELAIINGSLIFYESPNRIIATLNDILEVFGNVDICVAKELTKIYEQFYRGNVKEIIESMNDMNLKGEFVIIVENNLETINEIMDNKIEFELKYLKEKYKVLSNKDISEIVSYKLKISKKRVYNILNRIGD